ncbi:uncharacterized protein LACBIDRAFT_321741 [Laccaria bicolor S238N-H82]|uniref:Predicted protein n=1 Tax=Laccaria bicolor (strain S238N-H82 / ATCC MYA-4686) TaxID=486041 RepID=B0CTZ9_LACBS|nr:uncharacterized protein LACBIDRAFT_321741 [Laccaria bicolor S238N-H82]EDR14588.1 predicted protein [Laccaria bicolor S238N-H82]|eukprot:XP_001875147.1 predicted protein [Laccaria bicolor S238N-H82]
MAGKGHSDGYSQNNIYSVSRSQGDILTHGRPDHDVWQGELDGGVAWKNFAPSVRSFRSSDKQAPLIPPPPPPHSPPSESTGSPSNSKWVVGSEALVKVTTKRRKKPAIYKCNFNNCKRDFTTKANQKHHKNAHLGIKPYGCVLGCGKDFGVGHAMKRHLKTCVKNVSKQPSDDVQQGGVEESLYPMLQVFPLSTPHPDSMCFSVQLEVTSDCLGLDEYDLTYKCPDDF